ncbi:MAG: glycosyltransferase family 2 protein [Bacteroidetes bacterium]|uniref:Glycosyltransferase family 2 protein n=1 Tax=Candidatus Pullibacteroides excrementavium TaxID=2840905 RepID=A0A9D9DRF7_9BACT|nr:glycosyltransferase family 2 protein [Candidatus Pullibacteroides excrementavium]
MEEKPLISIVVPVYNVEQYVGKCLDSLLGQTLKDIEVICVDDCSTDASLSILNAYGKKDNRVKVITSSVNGKQGTARNIGIRAARAEYIGLVDSDDWVAETMYENLYEAARRENADVVVGNYAEYYSESDIRPQWNGEKGVLENGDRGERNRGIIARSPRIWTSIFKRKLFVDNGLFYPENLFYEDNAIGQALYCSAGKIVKVDKLCYFYRCNNVSTTRRYNDYRFFDRIETSKLYLENMKRLGFYSLYKQECDDVFFSLFYEATITGSLFHFDPPAKKYINLVKREICEIYPHFHLVSYLIRSKTSLFHKIVLALIGIDTDFGVLVCTALRRCKRLFTD